MDSKQRIASAESFQERVTVNQNKLETLMKNKNHLFEQEELHPGRHGFR